MTTETLDPVLTRQLPPRAVRRGSFRRPFVVAIMAVFLLLRAATSGPPLVMDADSRFPMRGAQQMLSMTAAGAVLIGTLTFLDPALGFAFIVADMTGFGAYFDVDQWGVANLFKFRDLEMGLLMSAAVLFFLLRPSMRGSRVTRLGRFLNHVSIAIVLLTIALTLITLRTQDLATTARYSRQLYLWLLIPIAPQFIRTARDVRRVIQFLVAFIALTAVLYIAQSLTPPQTVLRYSLQLPTGSFTRAWAPVVSATFVGGIAIFAYQLQAKHRNRLVLWVIFALCAVAVVMSQSRSFTAMFIGSFVVLFCHWALVTHRIRLLIRVSTSAAGVLLLAVCALWATDRMGPLGEFWNHRIAEARNDIQVHEGNLSSRIEMFTYLPVILQQNGGGDLAPLFGLGLIALPPEKLAPMKFFGSISPPIWADNGLAGVVFTAGYFGLFLLFLFIAVMMWRLWRHLLQRLDPVARSLTVTALLYFLFAPAYMVFSAHFLGNWEDALAIVTLLILVERTSALLVPR